MTQDTLRVISIHHSLLRPQLLAGGERTLTLLNVTLAAALVFGIGGVVGIGTGIVLGSVVQWLLVMVARRDDQAAAVYRRHIRHQRFFAAAAYPNAAQQPPRA